MPSLGPSATLDLPPAFFSSLLWQSLHLVFSSHKPLSLPALPPACPRLTWGATRPTLPPMPLKKAPAPPSAHSSAAVSRTLLAETAQPRTQIPHDCHTTICFKGVMPGWIRHQGKHSSFPGRTVSEIAQPESTNCEARRTNLAAPKPEHKKRATRHTLQRSHLHSGLNHVQRTGSGCGRHALHRLAVSSSTQSGGEVAALRAGRCW